MLLLLSIVNLALWLASCRFGAPRNPATTTLIAPGSAFVEEIIFLFLVNFPKVIPFLRREILLNLLNDLGDKRFCLAVAFDVLCKVLVPAHREHVCQDGLEVLRLVTHGLFATQRSVI